jgi:hypothetical protein
VVLTSVLLKQQNQSTRLQEWFYRSKPDFKLNMSSIAFDVNSMSRFRNRLVRCSVPSCVVRVCAHFFESWMFLVVSSTEGGTAGTSSIRDREVSKGRYYAIHWVINIHRGSTISILPVHGIMQGHVIIRIRVNVHWADGTKIFPVHWIIQGPIRNRIRINGHRCEGSKIHHSQCTGSRSARDRVVIV